LTTRKWTKLWPYTDCLNRQYYASYAVSEQLHETFPSTKTYKEYTKFIREQ